MGTQQALANQYWNVCQTTKQLFGSIAGMKGITEILKELSRKDLK